MQKSNQVFNFDFELNQLAEVHSLYECSNRKKVMWNGFKIENTTEPLPAMNCTGSAGP